MRFKVPTMDHGSDKIIIYNKIEALEYCMVIKENQVGASDKHTLIINVGFHMDQGIIRDNPGQEEYYQGIPICITRFKR
jgi:hypothetical protein